MDPSEIQARATIAAALIVCRAVEVPAIPISGDGSMDTGAPAARPDRLRLPGDFEPKASLITPA
jgi:hypothetical protein